jgi:hypothetical protein
MGSSVVRLPLAKVERKLVLLQQQQQQ